MNIRRAVIPVAGFGTRFLPATKATPKEMFPLVDKPLAQYAVEEAVAAGIEEIIFITGQAKRAIEDHFDRNFSLEYLLEHKQKPEQIRLIREISESAEFVYVRQKAAKGLGHAILQAKNLVNDAPFAVILPDNVFTGQRPALGDVIGASKKVNSAVTGVKEVPEDQVSLYGIANGREEKGFIRVESLVEKPIPAETDSRWAQVGRYVLVPEIFPILENLKPGHGGEIQLNDALAELAGQQPVYAAEVSATYHDAGDKLGYAKAFTEFALARDDLGKDYRAYLEDLLK